MESFKIYSTFIRKYHSSEYFITKERLFDILNSWHMVIGTIDPVEATETNVWEIPSESLREILGDPDYYLESDITEEEILLLSDILKYGDDRDGWIRIEFFGS